VLDKVMHTIIYNGKFSPDSAMPEHKISEEFTVFIGEKITQSQSTNFLITLLYQKENDLEGFVKASSQGRIPRTSFNGQIFINYPEDKVTVLRSLALDKYKYTEPLNNFNWKLHDDYKNIEGRNVQKATCYYGGRNWVAWFAKDIPIAAGPFIFHGLPGLIVEISDSKNYFEFTLRYITDVEVFEYIEIPTEPRIELTKQEFFKARQQFLSKGHAAIMQSIEASGGSLRFDDPADAARRANANMRRNNNYIELKAD
jgi:GLPGLI family protein